MRFSELQLNHYTMKRKIEAEYFTSVAGTLLERENSLHSNPQTGYVYSAENLLQLKYHTIIL